MNNGGTRDGGFNCEIRVLAKVSQTAVSCLCAAIHMSSSNGPGGNESNVRSEGRAVMALKRSLKAYKQNVVIY